MTPMTIKQIAEFYTIFTVKSLRWLLYHRNENGLSKCVLKVGRRIFIIQEELDQWLLNQKESGGGK